MPRLPIVLVLFALVGCADTTGPSSTEATVIIPTITTEPNALIATPGSTAILSVVASGSAVLTYEWYHNSTSITGAVAGKDSLTISPVTTADSGSYFVIVRNSGGVDTSRVVTITVRPAVSSTALRQEGGAGSTDGAAYQSDSTNESAIYVLKGGLLQTNNASVVKNGSSSDLVASRDKGTNAAVLASDSARIYMTGGIVLANAAGAAGLYASGSGTKLTLTGGTVSTLGASSPVIGATGGATIIVTASALSAAASDAIVAAGSGNPSITLSGVSSLATGTGTLISAFGTVNASLMLDSSSVSGNAAVATGAAATIILQRTSAWSGAMQGGSVALDATSVWSPTAASAVGALTGLVISGGTVTNINSPFAVTYDASRAENAPLAGRTFTLSGGGQLAPRR